MGSFQRLCFESILALKGRPLNGGLAIDQRHELGAGRLLGFKDPPKGAGDRRAARFSHAANGHARMFGLDHNGDAAVVQMFLHHVGDGLRHPLLDLRSPRNLLDDPCELTQPGDFAGRDIGDMGDSIKWKQMVFAHAGESNVANQYHFVVRFGKDDIEVPGRIEEEPAKHLLVHFSDAARGVDKPRAIGIFADGDQDLSNRLANRLVVDLMNSVFLGHCDSNWGGVGLRVRVFAEFMIQRGLKPASNFRGRQVHFLVATILASTVAKQNRSGACLEGQARCCRKR